MKTLTVICPAFNEEEGIRAFYSELADVLATISERYSTTIIFVVDRCEDNTLGVLREIAHTDRRVRVLALSSRFGHQMSLLAGIDHADGDAVVMLDSDLQHPPQLIPKMLEKFEEGHDIVYTIRNETRTVGFFRRMAGEAFYSFISKLSPTPIDRRAADFRLISRKVCRVFQTSIRERNQFMRGLFSWVGFRRAALEFEVAPRIAGRSKYSFARLLRFALQGLVSFTKWPLQLATIVGMVMALFGFAMAVVTLFQYFFYSHLPSGWTTIVILISGFNGITLVFLGLIGEYIGAIFDEVKGRPHYIVDERINFDEE